MGVLKDLKEQLYKNFEGRNFTLIEVADSVVIEKDEKYNNPDEKIEVFRNRLGQLCKKDIVKKIDDTNQIYKLVRSSLDSENVIVNSLQEFNTRLHQFKKDNKGKRLYFRGERSNHRYRTPSIYRQKYLNLSSKSDRFYSDLLSDLGDLKLMKEDKTTQLARLQHYNAPTRLLDVTSNPLVALYFATETKNYSGDDHCVYFYAVDEEKVKYQHGHTASLKSNLNWMSQKDIYNFLKNHDDEEVKNEFLRTLNEVSDSSYDFVDSEKIYSDLNSSTFVEFVKESNRMKNQSGAFIMPPM